jgi:hypothetical protein
MGEDMKGSVIGILPIAVCSAVAAIFFPTITVSAAEAKGADAVTVTIDRTVQVGTSRLSLGVTHTNSTVLSGDPAAVARGRALLQAAVTYQTQFIYGWGTLNPEPSPGVFDWRTLDARVSMMRAMGATIILNLCCAPDWMTDLGTNTSTYKNMPPTPEHYGDFADLVRRIALRYPDVKYYVVWSEMKGLWNRRANQWDIASYIELYNRVYDVLKSVSPDIKVGGPYLVIEGTGTNTGAWFTASPVTHRNATVINYILHYGHGFDFVTLDRSVKDYHDPKKYSEAEKLSLTHTFGDAVRQVRTVTSLPIWYSEDHIAGQAGGGLLFQGAGNASMLYHELEEGASLTLNWEPEPQPSHVIDDNLYTSTHQAGGGQPYPTFYSYKVFHDYFPPGAALYQATSSSSDLEVLASATRTLLINKTSSPVAVTVNGTAITVGGYEVRIVDQNGKTVRYPSQPPTILNPANGSTVGSSFTVTGGAEPTSTVRVYDGGALLGSTSPDTAGNWSFSVSGLGPGTHSLTATATGGFRLTSSPSPAVTITISGSGTSTSPDHGARPSGGPAARLAVAPDANVQGPQRTAVTTGLQWARQFGTKFADRASSVASYGTSLYVAGGTYGSLSGQPFAGSSDAFLQKYDASGNLIWTREFGTVGDNAANGVVAGSTGVYVVGLTDAALPGQIAAGSWDGFIRKYDENGNVQWTRAVGTAGEDAINAVTQDSSGIYVAGFTNGAFHGLTNSGYDDAFVQKYGFDGTLLWTNQFGTGDEEYATALAVDSTGVYVAGSTAGALSGQTHLGMYDAFVRKYSLTGGVLWTTQFGTSLNDEAYGVTTDSAGLYVVGYVEGALPSSSFFGGYDCFVRKYGSGGSLVWTNQFGSAADDRVLSVAADSSGVYVTGWTRGTLPGQTSAGGLDVFSRAYTPTGTVSWTRQWGGTADDQANSATTDSSGVVIAGETTGALPGQTSSGDIDAFVAKWSKTGQ